MTRDPGTMKQAYNELVQACGGFDAAATKVRVSQGQLHRYTDPNGDHETVHMPCDVVAALEASCGKPIVSGWLVRSIGFRLVGGESNGDAALKDLVFAAIDAIAALHKTSLASVDAGTVTQEQAGKIRCDATRAIDALSAIHDKAATIQRNGEGG